MGKLQSFLQLGGVFADFPGDAPAVASTYLVNRAAVPPRPGAGSGRLGETPGQD